MPRRFAVSLCCLRRQSSSWYNRLLGSRRAPCPSQCSHGW
jgi:hypothetical protein